MNEPEVSPGESNYRQIADFLRRHPFVHFSVMFCYWFTAVAIFDDLQATLWQIWPRWSQAHHYSFALSMAVSFFLFTRFSTRFVKATEVKSSIKKHQTSEPR